MRKKSEETTLDFNEMTPRTKSDTGEWVSLQRTDRFVAVCSVSAAGTGLEGVLAWSAEGGGTAVHSSLLAALSI